MNKLRVTQGWWKQLLVGQAKYKEKVIARKARHEILYFNDIYDDDIISSICPAAIVCASNHDQVYTYSA